MSWLNLPVVKWAIGIAVAVIILWLVSQLLVALGGSFNFGVGTFHFGVGSK